MLAHWPKDRYLELAPKYWAATRARLDPRELAGEIGPLTVPPPTRPPKNRRRQRPRLNAEGDGSFDTPPSCGRHVARHAAFVQRIPVIDVALADTEPTGLDPLPGRSISGRLGDVSFGEELRVARLRVPTTFSGAWGPVVALIAGLVRTLAPGDEQGFAPDPLRALPPSTLLFYVVDPREGGRW